MSQRVEKSCPTCRGALKKGHLWLGGKDYLQCPDCGGTGVFVMYEQKVTPATHIAVDGLKPNAIVPYFPTELGGLVS